MVHPDSHILSLNAGWLRYRSFSQQKNSMQMRMGYPLLKTNALVLGLNYQLQRSKVLHDFSLHITIPSTLDSDNGTGMNELLEQSESIYSRAVAEYTPRWKLIRRGGFRFRHGPAAGLLFDHRKLVYLSGAGERSYDLNLFMGPSLQAVFHFNENWHVSAGFDGLFYLPFLNYGRLSKVDREGDEFYASPYHGFYYQTHFKISAGYKRYVIGFMMEDMVGYANPDVSFDTEGMNHFKLEKIYQLKISVQL